MNRYPAGKCEQNVPRYPPDRDLSNGWRYPPDRDLSSGWLYPADGVIHPSNDQGQDSIIGNV